MSQIQADNPIRQIRSHLKLTQAALARKVGVTIGAVYLAERGGILRPRRIISGLGRLGFDAAALEADYSAWLQAAV